jgi:hypothetical protein
LDLNKTCSKENIKTSAKESQGVCELKQHKPGFDEECSRFLDQRKQAKMYCLQYPNQSSVNNLILLGVKIVDISRTKRRNI